MIGEQTANHVPVFPLLFDSGNASTHDPRCRQSRQARGNRRADRGGAARRSGPLSGSQLPVGAESRRGHAVRMDAEPVPRLHPRVPLLLCAPVSRAVRNERRRRVRVGHPGQAQSRRRADARARSSVVEAGTTSPSAPRPTPTSRLKAHYKLTRGAIEALTRASHADRARHERPDGRPGRRRPAGALARRQPARST